MHCNLQSNVLKGHSSHDRIFHARAAKSNSISLYRFVQVINGNGLLPALTDSRPVPSPRTCSVLQPNNSIEQQAVAAAPAR